ncbi:MAG: hypothetical protein ACR2KF_03200 [Nitrososphaeraceae archaeon]
MIFLTKPKIALLVTMAIVIANVSLLAQVRAESGVGNDVFKVIVTLFGITNSTKDVVTLVNVEDQTKIKLFNAENPETEGQDKVSYTITFPGIEVQDGDPYTVCTMSAENFKLDCDKGNNSPLNRPEFVDINVGNGDSSENKKQNEDQD